MMVTNSLTMMNWTSNPKLNRNTCFGTWGWGERTDLGQRKREQKWRMRNFVEKWWILWDIDRVKTASCRFIKWGWLLVRNSIYGNSKRWWWIRSLQCDIFSKTHYLCSRKVTAIFRLPSGLQQKAFIIASPLLQKRCSSVGKKHLNCEKYKKYCSIRDYDQESKLIYLNLLIGCVYEFLGIQCLMAIAQSQGGAKAGHAVSLGSSFLKQENRRAFYCLDYF